jgi:hypothetical protein
MADTSVFDLVCGELEQRSTLSRLEARGTVRLALKEAGLDPASVGAQQMRVVLEKVLPRELQTRRIADAAGICASLVQRLSGLAPEAASGQTPEAIFGRLASS